MKLTFDEEKATQAAALFLKLRGGRMSYMKLIKLLYLADRASLLRYGKPITMDLWCSMIHGPVLSNVLNLITDPSRVDSTGSWAGLISPPLGDQEVALLKAEIPNDRLSQAEEKVVVDIFHRYGEMNRWDLVELLHKGEVAPEWKEVAKGARVPISIQDILITETDHEEALSAESELISLAGSRQRVSA